MLNVSCGKLIVVDFSHKIVEIPILLDLLEFVMEDDDRGCRGTIVRGDIEIHRGRGSECDLEGVICCRLFEFIVSHSTLFGGLDTTLCIARYDFEK